MCTERGDQLRVKAEQRQREQQGAENAAHSAVCALLSNTITDHLAEEMLYAKLWEEDRKAKCQREEVEAAMQLERNMEMLKVSLSILV